MSAALTLDLVWLVGIPDVDVVNTEGDTGWRLVERTSLGNVVPDVDIALSTLLVGVALRCLARAKSTQLS